MSATTLTGGAGTEMPADWFEGLYREFVDGPRHGRGVKQCDDPGCFAHRAGSGLRRCEYCMSLYRAVMLRKYGPVRGAGLVCRWDTRTRSLVYERPINPWWEARLAAHRAKSSQVTAATYAGRDYASDDDRRAGIE